MSARCLTHALILAGLVFGSFAPAALAADLLSLNGKRVSGELVSLSDKEIVLRTASGSVKTPVAEILLIDLQPEAPLPSGTKYADLELIDGSQLHCSKIALKGRDLEVTLPVSEQKLTVPLAAVVSWLNEAHDPAVRQEWKEKFQGKKTNQDVLVVRLNGILNGLEGTLGEGNEKGEIHFEYGPTDNRKQRDIDPARVQGLLFQRSLEGESPSPLCKIRDVQGNSLVASAVAMTPTSFTITMVAGPKVEYPRSVIAKLDYNNDKVVFLSDLKPVEVIERSRQGRKDTWRADRNLENGSLQLGGQPYSKGLALHAHTELLYNLDGKYAVFEAVLGMDDRVGGNGQPVVKIEADGREIFAATFTRKEEVQRIKKEVRGVRQLRITVTSSGIFDFGDHVDLANAKLSK